MLLFAEILRGHALPNPLSEFGAHRAEGGRDEDTDLDAAVEAVLHGLVLLLGVLRRRRDSVYVVVVGRNVRHACEFYEEHPHRHPVLKPAYLLLLLLHQVRLSLVSHV